LVKKLKTGLNGSCDSFVLETDVHFSTDTNLLFDALRKMIILIMNLCDEVGMSGWRKSIYILKQVRKLFKKAEKARRSKSSQKEQSVIKAHLGYLDLAQSIIDKVSETVSSMCLSHDLDLFFRMKIRELHQYINHAERQIDQIRRRVIEGETIPHHEKVFSIFQEHTEWLSKGKAGTPVELGLNVCVVKDQFGFILHYHVMQNEKDVDIAVEIISETKERFPNFRSCSFDKGFHSPYNQEQLAEILDEVVLPRKGKLSKAASEIENSSEFRQARRKHSAVESSINALENHGLDRCRDHGLDGFKRYVGLAVVARNIQITGHIVQQKQLARDRRQKRARAA